MHNYDVSVNYKGIYMAIQMPPNAVISIQNKAGIDVIMRGVLRKHTPGKKAAFPGSMTRAQGGYSPAQNHKWPPHP